MFHFPGCPLLKLWIHLRVTGHYPSRVPPFGNPRINAYLRLPSAYRSLSRPSSAISAMASTLRSCSLDLASSRYSLLPKTTESSEQLRLLLFVSSLCSFQGAFEGFQSFKTIQKSIILLSDSVGTLANFIDTLCRYCLFCKRLAGFSGFLQLMLLSCRPRI